MKAATYMRLAMTAVFVVTPNAYFAQTSHTFGLPHVFGDHMVLQSNRPVPVWGWAEPGDTIVVSFAGERKVTTAAAKDGTWSVALDPMKPSFHPEDLIVTGRQTLIFHDVLVGEVWLCSGQSNMQKPLGTWRGQPVPTINFERELSAANYPALRLLNTEIAETPTPARDLQTTTRPNPDYPWLGWVATTPSSLDEAKFSAVCYFFGRKLHNDLNVPVGLIEATAGGTHIEAWMPSSAFSTDPDLADWAEAAKTPSVQHEGTRVTTLYNGMIAPLVPYSISGVLWYQGESNVYNQDGAIYAHKQEALIESWRKAWGSDLPFYFVQLPPLLYSVTRSQYVHSAEVEPIFWEAQSATLRLPHTGMVVTTDVGDPTNIHTPHKKEVGERLALVAEAKVYGRKVEYSGPVFRSMKIKGGRAILRFDHAAGGLISIDGKPLNWFTIASEGGKFLPAAATIHGDTVVVSNDDIKKPARVRFAWSEAATPNLFNKAGLPASPFRTDNPFTR